MNRSRRVRRTRTRHETVQQRRSSAEPETTVSIGALRIITCGVVFVLLVTLKLLIPQRMDGVRGTLGGWLVRDADFAAAFSAVGHAVSGEGGMFDSLEEAYTAVFGAEEAQEVSGQVEVERGLADVNTVPSGADAAELPDAGMLPPNAAMEPRILGFSYSAPLEGTVTSSFGWRTHPSTGRESFHYGTDLAAEEGTDVLCFADGVVGVTAESTELGRYVTIHHNDGVITLYAHLSRVSVSSGNTVRQGEKLGEVGSTGNATGPHLHFEIQDGETYLDPAYYLF